MDIFELKEKRAAIVNAARAELDKAQAENRSWTQEDQNKFDKQMSEADSIGNQVKNMERMAGIDEIRTMPNVKVEKSDDKEVRFSATKEYRKAFDTLVRYGKQAVTAEEARVLAKGAGDGANIVAQEYENAVVQKMLEFNFFRKICNVITTASDRNIPVESSIATASWIDESGAVTTASDPGLGRETLSAYKLAHIVKYSWELSQDAQFDLATYLGQAIGRAFGYAEQSAFLTGAGTSTPKGVIVSAGTGVTCASATAITGDEIVAFLYSLAQPYRAGSVIATNDATVAKVRQLKDGDGQYLWVPGFGSEPDTLGGHTVYTSAAVDTIAHSKKVMCLFNPTYYTIADRAGMTFKILDQLYAANGQSAVLAVKRVDGKLLQADAAKNLVMG